MGTAITAFIFLAIIALMIFAIREARKDINLIITEQKDEEFEVLQDNVRVSGEFVEVEEDKPEKIEAIEREVRLLKEYEQAKQLAPKLNLSEPPKIDLPKDRPTDSVGYPLPSGEDNDE